MNAAVFGGAGFIGSHVADELSRRGYKVRIYDVKRSPYIRPDQKMIIGDILNEELVYKAIKSCEIVYNFAALADIDKCKNKPIDVVKSNILGNTIILEFCRLLNVKRFIFASTVYVYGENGAFYKSSKQACELFIEDYKKVYGLPYTILRYGSLYGDRADTKNSIYHMLKEALTTGRIVYYGSGDEMRELIHVRDAAHTSVDILDQPFENECVIITGQRVLKYKELLQMIKEMLNGKVEIVYKPRRSDTHYMGTPCTFNPKFAKKMIPKQCVDIGQGLLQCAHEIFSDTNDSRWEPTENIAKSVISNSIT